jgi:hypothetical protein
MAKRGDDANTEKETRPEVDLSESSVYGDDNDQLESDDVATEDRLDRLEAITGGADDEPAIFEGKLGRQFDALDASTEEEVDALKVNQEQDDNFASRDGSGRVADDLAQEQIASFTEVGPMSDDRGGESVTPGREDTSATLRRHRPHPQAGDDSDAVVEGNIDPPLDEQLDIDDPEHNNQTGA